MGLTARHQALLEARGLDIELLERLGVESSENRSGEDWIKIPYFDAGEIINWKRRTITGDKKFYQDSGKRPIFWNHDVLRDETLANVPLIITEGEIDAITALQCGFQRTVSVPNGAPAEETKDDSGTRYQFLTDAMPLLRDCREIILATDNDNPGANLLNDLALRIGKARCRWVRYPKGCKDLNDALQKFGHRGVTESLNRAEWVKVSGVYALHELPPVANIVAYKIGIPGLDKHYKIRLGDMTVIVGIPSHGKTTFLNEIGCRMAADQGWVCAFASFEQAPIPQQRRSFRTFYCRKQEPWQSDEERAKADDWIDRQFVFIVPDDDEDHTLLWLIERIKVAVLQRGAKLVVVDPWNEIEHARPMGMSETDYVGESLAALRRLAVRLRIHLIIATHPTKLDRGKDGKTPIPTLYDASGSAHWANKPDVGIVIFRDGETTTIWVQKSRLHDEIGVPGQIQGTYVRSEARYHITTAEQCEL